MPDTYTTVEDTPGLNVSAANGVLSNDIDADGDSLTAVLVQGTQHGQLTLNPDGSFSYQPEPEYSGSDGFTYRVSDGKADSPDVATVQLNVQAVNDPPAARVDLYLTIVGQTLTVPANRGVLHNDRDLDSPSPDGSTGHSAAPRPTDAPADRRLHLRAGDRFCRHGRVPLSEQRRPGFLGSPR